jgi:hypothetical protein
MGNTWHKSEIKGYEDRLCELSCDIAMLTYDQTRNHIDALANDLERQARGDEARGRRKLASKLYDVVHSLYEARDRMDEAWKICEPYMDGYVEKKLDD